MAQVGALPLVWEVIDDEFCRPRGSKENFKHDFEIYEVPINHAPWFADEARCVRCGHVVPPQY